MATETGGGGGRFTSVRERQGVIDAVAELCYPLYERVLANRRDFVTRVDTKLRESLRDTPVELFLSRALAVGLLFGLFLWIIGIAAGYVVFIEVLEGSVILLGLDLPPRLLSIVENIKIPLLVGLSGFVFGTAGFVFGFGAPLVNLFYEAYMREQYIDQVLPDTIAYMYALSVGGMNHIEILEKVADAEEVYGEVAREFQVIVQRTRYFDTDYRTAIRDRAAETPSESLNQFLTDMLSIATSGGDMTNFFDDKTDRHLEIARRRQSERLDTLELVGEMYLAISLFPLLLIILLVVMAMVGQSSVLLLYLTVYGILPLIGLAFLVIISTIKREDLADGYLTPPDGSEPTDGRAMQYAVFRRPVTAAYRAKHALFAKADRREAFARMKYLVTHPFEYFVSRPVMTLFITVPVAALFVAYMFVSGIGPRSSEALLANPVAGTVLYFYMPAFIMLLPLGIFRVAYVRYRFGILDNLSETLRKLSSTNDTGLTLLESIRTVTETSPGMLADELARVHRDVTFGSSLKEALIAFNNRYHVPRLARVIKLIAEAQETSSQITQVLTTAARASENQDELARDRTTRTRMQVAIIMMTSLTLLGVMAILKVQFLDVIGSIVSAAEGSSSPGGVPLAQGVNVERLSLLFFHAVTLQAVISGFIAGYLTNADLMSGIKYVVALLIITLVVWIPVS